MESPGSSHSNLSNQRLAGRDPSPEHGPQILKVWSGGSHVRTGRGLSADPISESEHVVYRYLSRRLGRVASVMLDFPYSS